MKNTSLGYHTFSFFQKMGCFDFSEVTRSFIKYSDSNADVKRFPIKNHDGNIIGWEYCNEKIKGLQWLLFDSNTSNGYKIYGVRSTVNPKSLIKMEYIQAARESDLNLVENIYNEEASKISPLLAKFGKLPVNRADYCLNIDLKELDIPCSPEQMMELIKRGNVPKHYRERCTYDEKSHRMASDPYSFYLKSNSMNINYYWKYAQQTESHPNFHKREDSRNVIRFEVQCYYPKLYFITKERRKQSKFYKELKVYSPDSCSNLSVPGGCPSIPLDIALSDVISEENVQKYFNKIIRKGDYFTLDGAKDIVESYHFNREKEERLIRTLELINKKRGIDKARKSLLEIDKDDFKRSLVDLDTILVNPVTIPRGWKIKHIPNPLRAYYYSVYEWLVYDHELVALRHIKEYLSDESIY